MEGGRPNNQLVIIRMHSRFNRHLQRVAGSKNIAEVITFTGRFEAETLKQVATGATQPEPQLHDRPWNHVATKRAEDAMTALHQAQRLQQSLVRRNWDERYLTVQQRFVGTIQKRDA